MRPSISMATLTITLFLVACSEKEGNLEEKKSLVIQSNDELFHKGNLDFADERFSSDYRGRGPEYIKEFVGAVRTAFPDVQVTIDPIIAEGNMTAWRRTHTGTHQGVFNGFQPTGKKITWESIIISRMDEDGKIAEEWGFGNLNEVLREENIKKSYEEILETADRYFETMQLLDADSVLAFWTDDLQMITRENVIIGKDALREILEKLYRSLELVDVKIRSRDIDATDKLAVEVFEYAETVRINNGEPQTLEGKQISVWKKIDNSWKISKVILIPTTDDPIHESF
jgi:predicted ester cyclase/ketosteroid isomerase-like protein